MEPFTIKIFQNEDEEVKENDIKVALPKGKLYFSIGEVAKGFDIAESTLRHWEKKFPHIQPQRKPSGFRFYTKKEVKSIAYLKYLLKEKKMTIDGANKFLLENKGNKSKEEKRIEALTRLKFIKDEISALRKSFLLSMDVEDSGED